MRMGVVVCVAAAASVLGGGLFWSKMGTPQRAAVARLDRPSPAADRLPPLSATTTSPTAQRTWPEWAVVPAGVEFDVKAWHAPAGNAPEVGHAELRHSGDARKLAIAYVQALKQSGWEVEMVRHKVKPAGAKVAQETCIVRAHRPGTDTRSLQTSLELKPASGRGSTTWSTAAVPRTKSTGRGC